MSGKRKKEIDSGVPDLPRFMQGGCTCLGEAECYAGIARQSMTCYSVNWRTNSDGSDRVQIV